MARDVCIDVSVSSRCVARSALALGRCGAVGRPWGAGAAADAPTAGPSRSVGLAPFEVLYSLSEALKCPTLLRYAGSTVLDVPFEPFAAATVHAHIELDIELPVSCALVLSPALAHGDEPCKTEHDASSDDDRPQ